MAAGESAGRVTETRTGGLAERPARPTAGRRSGNRNPVVFVREVVAELRKVIWPTRQELITYTSVVIVFVSVIIAVVYGLDYLFTWLVLKVFG
jgi:preprotein translocase subunit SecE